MSNKRTSICSHFSDSKPSCSYTHNIINEPQNNENYYIYDTNTKPEKNKSNDDDEVNTSNYNCYEKMDPIAMMEKIQNVRKHEVERFNNLEEELFNAQREITFLKERIGEYQREFEKKDSIICSLSSTNSLYESYLTKLIKNINLCEITRRNLQSNL